MTQAKTIYLNDYQPPPFLVNYVSLLFSLEASATKVISTVQYRRNSAVQKYAPLELDGDNLELMSVCLDGKDLSNADYALRKNILTLAHLPDCFTLEITTIINPEANTALEGLYRSSGNYCTQCEAQGFRRITYYQDRPDVMATFNVRIEGDKKNNPVLLSNGNPMASGDLDGGRHFAEWSDPFAKPCYLFALVAGDLACVSDTFDTASGRTVCLKIYTEAHHIDECGHAMASLKRAMLWDEQRYGLEYDLDLFMIVAVDDFNMGAMENKGLNIFNSSLVFASTETATDKDYDSIESVIGHEYFHNWTGNRVTCRDWFQLSLKEGLTVFRDQEFSADLHSRAVKRIEDVRLLRTHQFNEDASPMSHPIRPSSYMEINNFYTVTIYEKGAEVVRLYQTLLGIDGFRRGMDLYFQRHDGQAVCTEDFLAAMADANQRDLSQMQYWYDQAGTPQLTVTMDYDESAQTCTLQCTQSYPQSEHSADLSKKPVLIPLTLALLLPDGSQPPLQLSTEITAGDTERTLLVSESSQSFTFVGITKKPLPSLLREFSAPVELHYDYSAEENAFLMQYDSDPFNRWAAAQRLVMYSLLQTLIDGTLPNPNVAPAFAHLLQDKLLDDALKEEALQLPSEADIAEHCQPVYPAKIHAARVQLYKHIAASLYDELVRHYQSLTTLTGASDKEMQGRGLKNTILHYLTATEKASAITLANQQFQQADNMTDQYAALKAMINCDCNERTTALGSFEKQWSHHNNVMDKWFAAQANTNLPDTLTQVKVLMQHPAFDLRNPNKVRALLGTSSRNYTMFHASDGSGYAFIADQVLALDTQNPQMAARLARTLMKWRKLEPTLAALMQSQLQRMIKHEGLSADVYEIVSKSLI
ncbi:MAG: aminopeptidase N [Mariprofundales bacterium]